jgi:hypothetical protein
MRVNPIYSKRPGTDVHHNNNQCTERNNIESYNIKHGTGDYRLCANCKRLNAEGR